MLIDNSENTNNKKVHEWISDYTNVGDISIVTGYFTVGALAFLAKTTHEKIQKYRFILGDIVSFENDKIRTLDLLNQDISIEAAIRLKQVAQEAVKFLELSTVEAKTLEPNFCHAKLYLYIHPKSDPKENYYITGSSNLTEAGIGLKRTNNVELNIGGFGTDPQYEQLVSWFEQLWNRPQAHLYKTLIDEKGKTYKVDFKKYLIDQIKTIFKEYTPKELYYKVLFELFGEELLLEKDNPDLNRQIGRLENTIIFNDLFLFQQKGVLSLIKMLQKHNGAILADAVGLGKTWSALAVIKFYQLQGREVILICPKKLQSNWRNYLKHQNSRFEKDNFDYFIRFHTDLTPDLMSRYDDRADKYFVNEKPKLFVIDESHNLRNDKSKRYDFLVNEILAKNQDCKVLLLSATPINNSLNDIRNQFKLLVGGNAHGFAETLGIKNLDGLFKTVNTLFKTWSQKTNAKISTFIQQLPAQFFSLTDALIVARTRKMIEGEQNGLTFPLKAKPQNLFVTPSQLGNFDNFEELFDSFPPMLSGYQPSLYVQAEKDIDILHDEKQRDRFLVKMMYILLVKRLESSWFAFNLTLNKVLEHHQNALDRIKQYEQTKQESDLTLNQFDLFAEDDLFDELDEFTLGKKRKTKLSDIDKNDRLSAFKKDLKKDIKALESLQANLSKFESTIQKESKKPNHTSADDKLQALIDAILAKRLSGENNHNQKVIIFTVYKDTAFYLFDQLKARGFDKIAVVSGDASKSSDNNIETKKFEPLLQRFAPFTKLFKEKEWPNFSPSHPDLTIAQQFDEWQVWAQLHAPEVYDQLQQPIDILIATDTLSEGQNLQDCDMVINYDIHWNPVRIIQRMGRVDRLGSPNSTVFGINFWPSDNINNYLNLQKRIEQRMATMKLAGAEVHSEFSESFKIIAEDSKLEELQNAKMLQQMQSTWDDIEVNDQSLGFDDLSLEVFRQELLAELRSREAFYKAMPRGVYTGFKGLADICPQSGIVALLGYPTKKSASQPYKGYELIYINEHGQNVLQNQKEVLQALNQHKDEVRYVEQPIDHGDSQAAQKLADMLQRWLKLQTVTEEVQEDGSVQVTAGKAALDMLKNIRQGNTQAIAKAKTEAAPIAKFDAANMDLIAWFIVS